MKSFVSTSLLLIGFLIWGCNQNEPPSNLIEEDTYVDLLVELQLVKSFRESMAEDSGAVDSLQKRIYEKYNITEEQFRLSHNFYQEQYKEQKKRVDEAIERLRMDQVESDSIRRWEQ